MSIGQLLTRASYLGALVCLSLGCSANSGAASADGGQADQSAPSTTLDDGGQPPLNTGGGPDCAGPCCPIPQAGAACDAGDQDASCSTSVSCGSGNGPSLTLPFNLVCDGQKWGAVGGYCGDGGLADNGCPTAQPQNGAECALDSGTSCQYGLVCDTMCDAGAVIATADAGAQLAGDGAAPSGSGMAGTGCTTVFGRVGPAICQSGQWQTQSLGTCP
jgi:hypothetical protein